MLRAPRVGAPGEATGASEASFPPPPLSPQCSVCVREAEWLLLLVRARRHSRRWWRRRPRRTLSVVLYSPPSVTEDVAQTVRLSVGYSHAVCLHCIIKITTSATTTRPRSRQNKEARYSIACLPENDKFRIYSGRPWLVRACMVAHE